MANEEHLEILKQGLEVWNQWRKENPDITPFLFGASLSGEYLSGARLIETDLRGANLNGADLSVANLSGASLVEADLRWADLRWADLSRVELSHVDLSGADLSGVDLSEARCFYTHFANVDLSEAKGLETVRHSGPSFIDTHTLIKSKGKIPEIFLRGCGVPEEFITYMPSLIGGSAIQFYSCFISYSHADKSFARRVHDTLQMRGIRCWLDEHQMLPGHDIFKEVDRGIRLWDKVLLCASQNSLTSWWVDNELETLFGKERQLQKERGKEVRALIPMDLDGFLFNDNFESGKKRAIQSRLAANFQGWETDNAIFEREIERVIKALRTDEGREMPPKSQL